MGASLTTSVNRFLQAGMGRVRTEGRRWSRRKIKQAKAADHMLVNVHSK
jgi:hypothetical protein